MIDSTIGIIVFVVGLAAYVAGVWQMRKSHDTLSECQGVLAETKTIQSDDHELSAVLAFAEKFEDQDCLARGRISPTFRRFVAALARKEHRK